MDPSGLFALAFFVGLIGFVCFEAVQLVRGRVHLGGIGRAALELLIVAPLIVLVVVVAKELSARFGLNDLEARLFSKWLGLFVLLLVWAPWSHYRASRAPRRK